MAEAASKPRWELDNAEPAGYPAVYRDNLLPGKIAVICAAPALRGTSPKPACI
jgi:hypothetical protein